MLWGGNAKSCHCSITEIHLLLGSTGRLLKSVARTNIQVSSLALAPCKSAKTPQRLSHMVSEESIHFDMQSTQHCITFSLPFICEATFIRPAATQISSEIIQFLHPN
jgi:hypothetical protein